MKKGKKGLFQIIYGRTIVLVILLLMQIAILFTIFNFLKEYSIYFFGGFTLISILVLFYIINDRINPMFKIAWIIPILLIPVFGTLFYLFMHIQIETTLISKRHKKLVDDSKDYLIQDYEIIKELRDKNCQIAAMAKYIYNFGGYPIYKNSNAKFFSLGEDKFKAMKEELEKAEKFIFMEYFIVEMGYMWNSILEILQRKVKEGVEVRFMYDGMGSLLLLPYSYPRELEKLGIKCKIFSPIRPALSTYQNNRDHRKILVIDGKVAFTGGVNLGDEYINIKERFGHWKDTAIMIKGEAAKNFTIMFLQMWNIDESNNDDCSKYILSPEDNKVESDGYIVPYGDSPLDDENTGEAVYIDIINLANKYVHIMTPYLILDYEMLMTLKHCAKKGIETIIIMPHIPDKAYAFYVAKTYYEELIESGVKIYEYIPGFVHAKVFVSDDDRAVVGTINLDFRSLYLHFECGAFLYNNSEIAKIEEDFQETLKKCKLVTLEECKKMPLVQIVLGKVLRLFAPLM